MFDCTRESSTARRQRLPLIGLLFALLLTGCATRQPEATSLGGEPLYAPERSAAAQERLQANLAEAQAAFDADPDEMNTIWLGRRLAYMTRYREAIEVYTDGLRRFPDSYRLYRHRGHRYISTRRFDDAIADFERAYALMPRAPLETEADGIPNRLNIPLSSTQFNVLYHYALAYYLKGDFARAEELFSECLDVSVNPDLLVATSDWLYMSLRRQGKTDEARELLTAITLDLEIIENDSYFKRLLMYKGQLPVDELFRTDAADVSLSLATQGYGVANWYLYNGQPDKAREIWDMIEDTGNWSAFGYIAMEADRARLASD